MAAAYSGLSSAISKLLGRKAAKMAQAKGQLASGAAKAAEELTVKERNDLIIKRYLLEQVVSVERARRHLARQNREADAAALDATNRARMEKLRSPVAALDAV